MAGTTYSKFFWQDWFGDKKLRLCSAGAQGFWMRCLCLAAEAPTIGHVTVEGEAPTDEDLSELFGPRQFPVDDVKRYRAELVARNVCDVSREGIMISRRLQRDDARRRRSSAGGKKSAEVRHGKYGTSGVSSKGVHELPSTRVQSPSTTNHPKPQQAGDVLSSNLNRVDQLGKVLGINPTTHPGGHRFIEQFIRLEDEGIDFEKDLLPAIQDWRAKGNDPNQLRSLNYFRPAAEAKRDARKLAAELAQARAAAPIEPTDRAGWVKRFKTWLDCGYWLPKYGPRPRSGQCGAPADLLEQALKLWTDQGGHPQGGFPADPNARFREWKHLRDLRDDPDCDYGVGLSNVVQLPPPALRA